MKNCIVETPKGFRLFGSKTVNTDTVIELSGREIFEILKKTGVKVFEVIGDTRIRLTMDNYKITNIVSVKNAVAPQLTEAPVFTPHLEERFLLDPEEGALDTTADPDDYIGEDDTVESDGVVDPKEEDVDTSDEVEDPEEIEIIDETDDESDEEPVETADDAVENVGNNEETVAPKAAERTPNTYKNRSLKNKK